MNRFLVFGLTTLILSVYAQDATQTSSSGKKQPVEKADVETSSDSNDDGDNTDLNDAESDMEDEDVIELDDEDSDDNSDPDQT